MVEEQGDLRFGADNLLLGVVAELLLRSRRGFCVIRELVDDSPEFGVEAASGSAFGPDAHFAGAVPPEHGPVLDECDGASHACCGNRRRGTSVTATNHDQIERTRVTGGPGEAADGSAPRAQFVAFVWQRWVGVGRQEHGIAASVEAGEIVQGECWVFGGCVKRTCVLPVPVGALGAECVGEARSVDEDVKPSRASLGFPACGPVLGADPNVPGAGFGECERGFGIADGFTEAVCHEVGRAHFVDELGVENPAALLGKRFRFDQKGCGIGQMGEGGCAQNEGNSGAEETVVMGFHGVEGRCANGG